MTKSKSTKKLPVQVRNAIICAINAAQCGNASFGGVHNHKLVYEGEEWTVDDFVKSMIRIHHYSWIVEPLKMILNYDDGESIQKSLVDYRSESLKESPEDNYGPCGEPEHGLHPLYKQVCYDVTQQKDTQLLVCMENILLDANRLEITDKIRVLEFLLEKEKIRLSKEAQ